MIVAWRLTNGARELVLVDAQLYYFESIIISVLFLFLFFCVFILSSAPFVLVGDTLPAVSVSWIGASEVMNSAIGFEAARDHGSVG